MKWSSYHANAWGDLSWLKPHCEYERLGSDVPARVYAYRELFLSQLGPEDLHNVRRAAHYCQPLGDERFADFIRDRYGVKLGNMRRGRTKSCNVDVDKN